MKNLLKTLICFILTAAVFFSSVCFASVPSLDAEGESAMGSSLTPELPEDSPFEMTDYNNGEYRKTGDGQEYLIIRPNEEEEKDKDIRKMVLSDALCLMLLPAEEDMDAFLEQTGWNQYASMENITIVCCRTDWQEQPENAAAYLENIYRSLLEEDITDTTAVFLAGYEKAADYAAQEALLHTQRYTGLVSIGGEGLTEELLAEYTCDSSRDQALSVWLIAQRKTQTLTKNITFWKDWNGIENYNTTSYQLTFADELYLPRTSTASEIDPGITRMGAVLFSRCSDCRNSSVSSDIAQYFFSGVRTDEISFRESFTGGELIRINDLHFSYHRIQLVGQQRDYWTYVPDSAITGEEPASLILCLHGNGGNGEDMIFRTMWHNVASENNCIILYPSSLYKSGSQHYWLNIKEEMDFLRELVEITCERFPIDRSHVYVTGYSNGAGMAQNLAVRCSDLFAAAAMSAPAYFDEEYYVGPINNIYPVAILFSYGTEDSYLKDYGMTADIDDTPAQSHLEYWRGLYGFQQEYYKVEERGKFTVYTYGSINHIPVCQWIIVEGKEHDYPEEETYIYFEFMKQFSKTSDGKLYYNGVQVDSARMK